MERLKCQDNIDSISTPEARKVYNWNQQVAGTYQRSRAFVRLNISKHGIVYGKLKPEHFVEDMVAEWFLSRFPLFFSMIESQRGTFVIGPGYGFRRFDEKIEELLPEFEKKLPVNELLKDMDDFDEKAWNDYYLSQFIHERKNRKYFLKNIPKKFHDWDGLKFEGKRARGNKELGEFINKH